MAVDDIDRLRIELPELFADRPLPPDWDDEWVVIPVDDPEAFGAEPSDDFQVHARDETLGGADQALWFDPETQAPNLGDVGRFPGSPVLQTSSRAPPPDAIAFYLPFHYFHPTWWGIYI